MKLQIWAWQLIKRWLNTKILNGLFEEVWKNSYPMDNVIQPAPVSLHLRIFYNQSNIPRTPKVMIFQTKARVTPTWWWMGAGGKWKKKFVYHGLKMEVVLPVVTYRSWRVLSPDEKVQYKSQGGNHSRVQSSGDKSSTFPFLTVQSFVKPSRKISRKHPEKPQ